MLTADVDVDSFQEHLNVHVVAPLILFKAVYPLLLKRPTKKFITVSSGVGMIGNMLPLPSAVYGTSKAALNFLTKRIHKDYHQEGLIAFPLHPGLVPTPNGQPVIDMGIKGAIEPEDSARAVLKLIDNAGPEEGGRFWDASTGKEFSW